MRRATGKLTVALVLACAAAAGGCYNAKEINSFLLQPRRPVVGLQYRVYPPDTLQITSLYVPEVNGVAARVRPDGKLNIPLLGEVYVAGLTPREIEARLEEAAKEYYEKTEPITVTVAGYASQRYYIFGQVGRAGPQTWTGRDTVLDALARAQPNNLAWPERITIVRAPSDTRRWMPPEEGTSDAVAEDQVDPWEPWKTGTEFHEGGVKREPSCKYTLTGVHHEDPDRPRKKMTFNLNAMMKSGDLSNNILLMPNDIIYVRPNPLAAIGLALQNLLFPVSPALQTIGVPAATMGAAGVVP